jgi:beta-amylase
MMRFNWIVLMIGVFLVSGWALADPAPQFSANVMAPLHVMNYNDPAKFEIPQDWDPFQKELEIAKSIGVDAVSVDVWWGDVERRGDNRFDWTYYREIFRRIEEAGLRLIPILSFHQCGGNVGDTYTSKLPQWIWNAVRGGYRENDLKYQSELGNYSEEYVSLWADSLVLPQYEEFMAAFVKFCNENHFTGKIAELNIGCGPAGELRYPSYNGHDWLYDPSTASGFWEKQDGEGRILLRGDRTNWPHRGAVQCYGTLPLQNFRETVRRKYRHNLPKLKKAWGPYGERLTGFEDIGFPDGGSDHGYPDGKVFKADALFLSGDYYRSQYGRDLLEWYHCSLLEHGERMIELARRVLRDGHCSRIPVGIKIPGIHWQMGTLGGEQPVAPRAAEIAAGMVSPGANFADAFYLNAAADANGHGYADLAGICKDSGRGGTNLHFTCLEMGDAESGGMGETPKQYSLARTLVGWVAVAAAGQGVVIKGENALSGSLAWTNEDFPGDWTDAWDHINEALERYPYSGITILRISDVTTVQNPENGKTVGMERYRELIGKFKRRTMSRLNY